MPTPLYRIKLVTNQKYTERPLNTRTCLIVDIFILKNFHYISFVLYRVSCVRNFLAYKLFGSQLPMFFYRTWVPFKSIKKRKRSAVNYKILLCFDSLTALFSVLNIDHEGRKKLFSFIRFQPATIFVATKKKMSVIAGKSGFYQPVLRRTSVYFIVRFLYLRHLNFQYRSSFQTV